MHLEPVKQGPDKWAVFSNEEIVIEGLTLEQLLNFLLNTKRKALRELILKGPHMSWLEARVRSGRVKCCNCGSKLDAYNENWAEEKQRCKACLDM